MRRLVGILAIVVLAIAACGDSDPTTTDEFAAIVAERDALAAQLAEATDALDGARADVDRLTGDLADVEEELGESRRDADDGEDVRAAFIDFVALSVQLGVGLGESDALCFGEAIVNDPDARRAFLSSGGAGEGSVEALEGGLAMVRAAEDCGIDLDDAGGIGGVGDVDGYGDDPALDALYDRCDGGDGAACDELYWSAPLGSAYEEFGGTCGGRFEVATSPDECDGAI